MPLLPFGAAPHSCQAKGTKISNCPPFFYPTFPPYGRKPPCPAPPRHTLSLSHSLTHSSHEGRWEKERAKQNVSQRRPNETQSIPPPPDPRSKKFPAGPLRLVTAGCCDFDNSNLFTVSRPQSNTAAGPIRIYTVVGVDVLLYQSRSACHLRCC